MKPSMKTVKFMVHGSGVGPIRPHSENVKNFIILNLKKNVYIHVNTCLNDRKNPYTFLFVRVQISVTSIGRS